MLKLTKQAESFMMTRNGHYMPRFQYRTLVSRSRKPDVNLFASRLNAKLPCYFAWKPDPNAYAILFFLFSVIGKVLQKIVQYKKTAIWIVLPGWPTQFWYPLVTSMLRAPPVRLNLQKTTPTAPRNISKFTRCTPTSHSLAVLCQGNTSISRYKLAKPSGTSSLIHGGRALKSSIKPVYQLG